MVLESDFKKKLIAEIMDEFPGAIILKNDANSLQGIPDHIILFERYWAMFEAKRSPTASHRPNQDYYVRRLNRMSLAQFVYPDNQKEFLHELQHTFRP
jgi:hypothetical protein